MRPANIPKDLPFLPGNVFNNPYQTEFHKTHALDKVSGIQTGNFVSHPRIR